MGLFKKRKRSYRRRPRQETIWDQLNWAIDPDTTREAIGFILVVLGILILLGLFNLAGAFGDFMISSSKFLFGVTGVIIPFVFIILGVRMLLPKKEDIHASVTIGIILCFIFIPGLFASHGGWVGNGIFNMFSSVLGNIGAIIALVAFSAVSLLISTNLSISKLREQLSSEEKGATLNDSNSTVPIFRAIQKENRAEVKAEIKPIASNTTDKNWIPPSVDLLEDNPTKPDPGDYKKNASTIEKKLLDFGIEVKTGRVNVGPTVSQYTLRPSEGVKLNQITARQNDLALALAAKSLRVEAPIPGQSAVGIEIPNEIQATVTLKEILTSPEFAKTKSNLTLALGRGVAGDARIADLKKMPHLLIAGTTGSGKSVCLNSVLLTLLYQNSPSDLRLLLIDPKRVEFTEYNNIPHLLAPVVTDIDKTVSALKWSVAEMERRYKLLSESSCRNIEVYNEDNKNDNKLPYIVVIIDELADLMTQAANEVETPIVRIAQMARATGIHLIVATQKPTVNVITGLIKSNIPTRIAFQTTSQVDSRIILDIGGAEKLLGRGDMLYLSADTGKPTRIQSVNVTDKEMHKVNEFLKKEGNVEYDESILEYKSPSGKAGIDGEGDISDELYESAKQIVISSKKASSSLLMRRLSIGYARSARLIDMLEEHGVVGPPDGSKPRTVLIDTLETDMKYKDEERK